MIVKLCFVGVLLCVPTFALAQQEEHQLPFEEYVLPAILNTKIQNELELVDEQKNQLERKLDRMKENRKTATKALKRFEEDGATEEMINAKREKLLAQLERDKSETKAEVLNILLPHQVKRLRQVTTQYMLREAVKSNQASSGILATPIRKYLDIDDTQAEQIKAKATEIKKRLNATIKKLTEEAQQELLRELTDEQRAKFKDLTGDPIDRLE